MKKGLLCLSLVACLCATLFAGCTGTVTNEKIRELLHKGNTIQTVSYTFTYTDSTSTNPYTELFFIDGEKYKREITDQQGQKFFVIGDGTADVVYSPEQMTGTKYPSNGQRSLQGGIPDMEIDKNSFTFVKKETVGDLRCIAVTLDNMTDGRTITLWISEKYGLIVKQEMKNEGSTGVFVISGVSTKPIAPETFVVPAEVVIEEDMSNITEEEAPQTTEKPAQ